MAASVSIQSALQLQLQRRRRSWSPLFYLASIGRHNFHHYTCSKSLGEIIGSGVYYTRLVGVYVGQMVWVACNGVGLVNLFYAKT